LVPSIPSSRTPLPSNRSEAVAVSKSLLPRGPFVDLQFAEAERCLVPAVQVELAGHPAVERPVVEHERVAQVGQRPARRADARVDLLAAVLARVAEREPPVGLDERGAVGDLRVGQRHVAVLDDQVAAGAAPRDIPRAHGVAAEVTFDARLLERQRHHAIEVARAANGDPGGARAERRHDAGEHLIAFLPVGAGHVERDRRPVAVRRAPLEGDERGLRRHDRGRDRDPLRRELEVQVAADGHVAEDPRIVVEGAPRAVSRGLRRKHRRRNRAREHGHAGRRRHRQVAVSRPIDEAAERPVERRVA
jgi:hypothetical protein